MSYLGLPVSSDSLIADDLVPFQIIRTETVLSRLPIHNLAKKGKVDIRISRRTEKGEVSLRWEVSYSDRYGQPRQLAYKLDTLVVNRRLDEERRPMPKLVRLGSLKQICKELEMSENGKNLRDLRTALLQNATAFINAHLTYRGQDGLERRLEAGFTRYGVVFTGEQLPDGRRADAVYVVLNDPYRDVVDHAPVRPLNYDYLKILRPAAQRFYEIVSYRIFAALLNQRPAARIAYSDYCMFSAQRRYYDYEHFRVQMYKVHKPHLESGYLASVQVQASTDGAGKPDWILSYTPGPKARGEFANFSRKQHAALEEEGYLAVPTEPDTGLLKELMRRGITEMQARKLVALAVDAGQVLDQLEWGDFIVRQAAGAFRNPPGFYVTLVREGILPPSGFCSTRRQQAEREPAPAAPDLHIELAYEAYRAGQVDRCLQDRFSPDELEREVAAFREQFQRQYPHLPAATLTEVALGRLRAELEKTLPLLSRDEFEQTLYSEK